MAQPPDILLGRAGSPLGEIAFATKDGALFALGFGDYRPRIERLAAAHFSDPRIVESPDANGIRLAIESYFAGNLRALDDIPVHLAGTPFQQRVWSALRGIPPGSTASYSGIAQRIGEPEAVRAVGAANGRNPIAIAVPCHRVVGASGKLTGYAGGLERKRWLLQHEGALTQNVFGNST